MSADSTRFTETFVGFRGLLTPHDDGVLCETLEVLLEHLLQSATASDECHEHKHAPEHTEACQETPALIPRQRIEDFPV